MTPAPESDGETHVPYRRGLQITPRLFHHLLTSSTPPVKALPSWYVQSIGQHVQSVEPSKQVMAQYWCPVVVEDDVGLLHVLHVDPLVCRQFRRQTAAYLDDIQLKRKRMSQRVQDIQKTFPEAGVQLTVQRLRREIAEAESHLHERLVPRFVGPLHFLHVLVDASINMTQFDNIWDLLCQEIPLVALEGRVDAVAFRLLTSKDRDSHSFVLEVDKDRGLDDKTMVAVRTWLQECRGSASGSSDYKLAKVLSRIVLAEATSSSQQQTRHPEQEPEQHHPSAVLLVASSSPSDLKDCLPLIRDHCLHLQVVGVFGCCPQDPEANLRRLADAGLRGSSLRLFFGAEYWQLYLEAHRKLLAEAEEQMEATMPAQTLLTDDEEVVSTSVLEMRLIERVLRECFAEEAQCESELVAAQQVLDRTLVPREDIIAVLQESMQRQAAERVQLRIHG